MTEAGRQREERSRDLERFITFIDAIVAIAITLLVLPLVELTADLGKDEKITHLLSSHFSELYSFALSFIVIFRLWLTHHAIMKWVNESNAGIIRWTFLWVVCVVFLPFPTSLVAAPGHQTATRVLYMGTMLAASACLTLLTWTVQRGPEIRDTGAPEYQTRTTNAAVTTALFALALLMTVAIPHVNYYSLFLLVLAGPVSAAAQRLEARRG